VEADYLAMVVRLAELGIESTRAFLLAPAIVCCNAAGAASMIRR
jgi:hypothetical protein